MARELRSCASRYAFGSGCIISSHFTCGSHIVYYISHLVVDNLSLLPRREYCCHDTTPVRWLTKLDQCRRHSSPTGTSIEPCGPDTTLCPWTFPSPAHSPLRSSSTSYFLRLIVMQTRTLYLSPVILHIISSTNPIPLFQHPTTLHELYDLPDPLVSCTIQSSSL